MSWILLAALSIGLCIALFALRARREEREESERALDERRKARERGSDRARLQYPAIDLTHCIGCGLCVAACPEEGVLEVVHGQAVVVHGARCVGHGRCAAECPVGAIALTLADVETRRDLPALDEHFEVRGAPGLFLAGEVTGFALIRTAIGQGSAVAREVARRVEAERVAGGAASAEGALELCIVGAGPAGLACSLEAKAQGLAFVTIDQEQLGGTVAKYPRRKLVMTQPVDLPLHGRLERTSYGKEELMELWQDVAERHALPLETGREFTGLERRPDGGFLVRTRQGPLLARHVALCLGRRGTPRKLGVPGEELPKVAYSLLDALSYQERKILVVGGGDSAIEAALGLSEQPGNEVTLSYRKGAFTRIKARNELRIAEALTEGRVRAIFDSEVERIAPESVSLRVREAGEERELVLANDEVFIFAGGDPPFGLLEQCGISFDPKDRPAREPLVARVTGLRLALGVAFALSIALALWTLALREYYLLPPSQRAGTRWHALLRPSGYVGLGLGLAAAAAMLANLAYLARRSSRLRLQLGSLQSWMTAHVLSGLVALLLAIAHSAMAPRDTVGGHALLGLAVLVATGAIGRYFYAFVPRAANGRELELEEVRARIEASAAEWDRAHPELGDRLRREVAQLVARSHWRTSFARRLGALWRSQRELSAALVRMRREGAQRGLSADQIDALEELARRAHRASLSATHLEDLRGILASWRYFHRWVALLVVLLLAIHVVVALRYADILGRAGPGG